MTAIRGNIEIHGESEGDVEVAVEAVLDSIRRGNTSGFDRNDTGSYSFTLDEEHAPPTPARALNGVGVPDYGGRTVYENADRAAESVIERAIRHNSQREPNPEWDVRSEVYAKAVGRVEQYMIAGNGPTEWLCFVFDEEGDLDHAYLRYLSSGDPAIIHLGQYDGEELYKQVKNWK